MLSSLISFFKKVPRPVIQNLSYFNNPYLGKISYSTIEKRPEASQILEEVEGVVFQIIKSASPDKKIKIKRESTFKELGFDSLDGVELVIAMEEYLGVEVIDREANSIQTVSEAIAVFHRYVIEKYNRDKLAVKNSSKDIVKSKDDEDIKHEE